VKSTGKSRWELPENCFSPVQQQGTALHNPDPGNGQGRKDGLQSSIYHVLPEAEPFSEFMGGAISRWVANVVREDQNSVVVCPEADDSWKFEVSRVRQVPLFRKFGRYKHIANKAGWPLRTAALRAIFGSPLSTVKSGDLVWVHNRPDLAAAICPMVHGKGAKLVLHMHNSHLARLAPHRAKEVRADRYVFVSNYLQQEAVAAHPEIHDSQVLYNGADSAIFYPQTVSTDEAAIRTVLFASRLVPEKGAHIFIGAMRELHARNIPVRGIIVGSSNFGGAKDTPYLHSLRQSAPQNVSFYPYCVGAQLGELFRQADLFCLPSVWHDPFPLAPLEAMACALPVVATRSGGIPEALRDGGGLLVERDSVPELTDALARVVTDSTFRRELALAGRASFLRNFTWTAVHDEYSAIAQQSNHASTDSELSEVVKCR